MHISFWEYPTKNLLSHKNGLTEEEINDLQSLKPGDRLILWFNDKEIKTSPKYNLKKFKKI